MNAVLLPPPLAQGRGGGNSVRAEEPSAKYWAQLEPAIVRNFDLLAASPDGVAKLRQLILTLAVQGRLVPQSPSDEPASVLLQKIREEKERLVAAGNIKGDKPLLDVAEEEKPFALPVGWEWVQMGDLVNASEAGWSPTCLGSPRRQNHWGVLKVSAVSWGQFDALANKELPADLLPRPEYEVKDGDFLLSRANTEELVARSVVVGKAEPKLMLSDKIIRLHVSSLVSRSFLNLSNNASHSRTHYRSNASGTSSSMKNVSREVVLRTAVALPPSAEQSRIVARVEELMRLCDALEVKGKLEAAQHAQLLNTLLGTLTDSQSPEALTENWQRVAAHFDLLLDRPEAVDALEQTILQLAVHGMLVPQNPADEPASVLLKNICAQKDRLIADGEVRRNKQLPPVDIREEAFELPQNWEWVRLGDLANFIDYRGKTPTKTESGVPLITAKNVRRGFINREPREFIAESAYATWMTRGFPKLGDLLFTTEAPLGNVGTIDIEEPFALAQRVICFSLYEGKMSGALSIFLQSPWMQSVLSERATGVTAQGIKSARLQVIPLPLPPLAEQSRIVARVESLRSLCADLRERLSASQATQANLAEALVASATA
jgi:type I restriction enzyme, S subunit